MPKVLAWSASADNAVQSEYIITENPSGTPLSDARLFMGLDERLEIVHEIIAIEKKMMAISLNRFVVWDLAFVCDGD